jgi:signal-transduction protein with cAMP-binding, CBS, and nucleotidyltransferase domain
MTQSHATRPQYYSLKGIAIFAGLSSDALERIQRRCCWRRYEPGEPIVDYLDASDDVFFITAGEAHVTIYSHAGKVVSFGDLGSGEVFGEFEIASRVSTHREAVTRELNRLSRIGLITRGGDALLVRDVDRLAQMVQDATGE